MYKFNLFILALLAMLVSMGLAKSSSSSAVVAETKLNGLVLTMQNTVYSDPSELSTYGVTNTAITVSGSALRASSSARMQQYLAVTYSEISAQFARYVSRHNLNGTTDYIILDMEAVGGPKHWGTILKADEDNNTHNFEQVISAYKLRVSVARALLPDAKICLFGIANPTNKCFTCPHWLQQVAGYTRASQHHVFDEADYLVPVCYMRYCEADSVIYVQHNKDMLTNSVHAAQSLTNSNGSHMPVFPYITPTIYSGRSACKRMHIPADELWQQIAWLHELNVETIGLWIGKESIPNSDLTIPQYLGQLLQAANQNSSGS